MSSRKRPGLHSEKFAQELYFTAQGNNLERKRALLEKKGFECGRLRLERCGRHFGTWFDRHQGYHHPESKLLWWYHSEKAFLYEAASYHLVFVAC